MPNFLMASTFVDTATKCFARASSDACLRNQARVRVHHGLGRRERLRGDDEQRRFRVHARQRGVHVVAVDVGDEVHGQARMRELAQRQADHLRAEVGTADADVDDVRDFLARVAAPLAVADGVAERFDAGEDVVHVGRDVLAVDRDLLVLRRAQGSVQDGALFRQIDLAAREHGIAQLLDAALARQVCQQCKRAPVQAVF
jgi:hypothetical protein